MQKKIQANNPYVNAYTHWKYHELELFIWKYNASDIHRTLTFDF